MPEDTLVICYRCRFEIRFGDSYVTRNGNRPDTYDCRDEAACRSQARQQAHFRDCSACGSYWSDPRGLCFRCQRDPYAAF